MMPALYRTLLAFLIANCCSFTRFVAGWDPVTGMGTPIYPEM